MKKTILFLALTFTIFSSCEKEELLSPEINSITYVQHEEEQGYFPVIFSVDIDGEFDKISWEFGDGTKGYSNKPERKDSLL